MLERFNDEELINNKHKGEIIQGQLEEILTIIICVIDMQHKAELVANKTHMKNAEDTSCTPCSYHNKKIKLLLSNISHTNK